MLIDDYTEQANQTNLMGDNTLYHLLGLISEIGELTPYLKSDNARVQSLLEDMEALGSAANYHAKNMRDKDTAYPYKLTIDQDDSVALENLQKELGDIPWFYTMTVRSFGYLVSDILQKNLKKLADRAARNVIKGSGDNR